jgi:hypothetical protein
MGKGNTRKKGLGKCTWDPVFLSLFVTAEPKTSGSRDWVWGDFCCGFDAEKAEDGGGGKMVW